MALFPKENNDPVLRVSKEGIILYANPASTSLLNHWKSHLKEKLPDDWKKIVIDLLNTNIHKDMELVVGDNTLLIHLVPIASRNYVNLYAIDITERKHYEQELKYLSGHNPVTKLVNRRLFEDLLTQSINNTEPDKNRVAVLFFELSSFQGINQTFGHEFGDSLLKKVAERITDRLPKQFIIGHIARNHFAIAIANLTKPEEADDYAAQLIALFKKSFMVAQRELQISINVGIAFFPLDGDTAQEVIKRADLAMFHARTKGEYCRQFYTEEMNQQLELRQHLQQDLHVAVEDKQFLLYYQPQLVLKTKKIVGAESLIRWQHPDKGLVSPNDFIQVLEQSHLMNELTGWALDTVAKQYVEWRKQGLPALKIAVNLTSKQFTQSDLITLLKELIEKYSINPQYLELEITERTAIESPNVSIAIMKQIRDLGIQLAIDDFGTDYSSLRYLQQLPINKIKIDKSFIDGLEIEEEKRIIVNAIINLAHNLGINVIAEGVETQRQFEFLEKNGCDEIQGYILSAPLEAIKLGKFVKGFGENK